MSDSGGNPETGPAPVLWRLCCRNGIQLILNSRVVSVSQGELTVESKDGLEQTIAIGACVWATGVAINPLAKRLQSKLPAQSNFRYSR